MSSSHSDVTGPPAVSGIEDANQRIEDANQTGYGMVMFYVFSAAVLAITFAVCALALVNTWWMLGVVFGLHLAVTTWVCVVINRSFDFNGDADLEQAASPFTGVPIRDASSVVAASQPRRRRLSHHAA
jgi:hypothetical protein